MAAVMMGGMWVYCKLLLDDKAKKRVGCVFFMAGADFGGVRSSICPGGQFLFCPQRGPVGMAAGAGLFMAGCLALGSCNSCSESSDNFSRDPCSRTSRCAGWNTHIHLSCWLVARGYHGPFRPISGIRWA